MSYRPNEVRCHAGERNLKENIARSGSGLEHLCRSGRGGGLLMGLNAGRAYTAGLTTFST